MFYQNIHDGEIELVKEEFEDTKGVIRIRKSRKDRHNTMAKRQKTTKQTTIYKTLHRKLKIEQHEPH
jgi:Holliday junction resolvase-like predicted endonuclease